MKIKIKFTVILLLLSALAFAACGGGGSDSGGGGATTPAGTFTKEVIATGVYYGWTHLFSSEESENRYMMLYLAEHIKGSGIIKSISLKYAASVASAVTCPNVTIKMGHTNVNSSSPAMSETFDDNIEQGQGSFQTVINNSTITIPAGNPEEYFSIPLSQPFNYNGVDNLILQISRTSACSSNVRINSHNTSPAYYCVVYNFHAGASTSTAGAISYESTDIKFNFAGGDNKVDYNTTHNTSPIPFSTTPGYQKVQMLYNKDSIAGSGLITGIGLQVQTTTANAATYTYTMKLGHSTNTDLVYTWIDNFNAGSPVTVASSISFRIPAGVPANEFIWLPIPDGSFTYNGTDNLVIELTIEAADGNVSLATHTTSNYNRMYGDPADDNAAVRSQYTHQIALRFYGGQVTVLLPTLTEGASALVLGAGQPGQSQKLYESYLLGTSGSITNVYVRLYEPAPAAASLTNYKLYMGHTVKTAYNIADTYVSNMDENAIVFSGTLTVPAGLKQGDWVKIPLSSPFVYNSVKNLSILFTTDAGPSGNIVRTVVDTLLFNNHTVGRNDNSVTSSGTPSYIDHNILELALDVVK